MNMFDTSTTNILLENDDLSNQVFLFLLCFFNIVFVFYFYKAKLKIMLLIYRCQKWPKIIKTWGQNYWTQWKSNDEYDSSLEKQMPMSERMI